MRRHSRPCNKTCQLKYIPFLMSKGNFWSQPFEIRFLTVPTDLTDSESSRHSVGFPPCSGDGLDAKWQRHTAKSSKFDETTFSFDDTKGNQCSFLNIFKRCVRLCKLCHCSCLFFWVPPKSTSQILQSDSDATRSYEIATQVLTMPLLWVVQMAPFDLSVKWVEKKRRLASGGMNGTGRKLFSPPSSPVVSRDILAK